MNEVVWSIPDEEDGVSKCDFAADESCTRHLVHTILAWLGIAQS